MGDVGAGEGRRNKDGHMSFDEQCNARTLGSSIPLSTAHFHTITSAELGGGVGERLEGKVLSNP